MIARMTRVLIALFAAALCWPGSAPGTDFSAGAVILVAKRQLQDKFYGHTILLARPLAEERHVGVILNKPTSTSLSKLFPNHPPSRKVVDPVFVGGPYGPEVIFALVHRRESPGNRSLRIGPDVYLATDSRVVDRIIENEPAQARFFAGVVMWTPGELADEVKKGLWYVQEPRSELLLRKPTDGLWEELVTRLEKRANTI
jgi:putative AlgH/UPF0301 family transcriptional regulator